MPIMHAYCYVFNCRYNLILRLLEVNHCPWMSIVYYHSSCELYYYACGFDNGAITAAIAAVY